MSIYILIICFAISAICASAIILVGFTSLFEKAGCAGNPKKPGTWQNNKSNFKYREHFTGGSNHDVPGRPQNVLNIRSCYGILEVADSASKTEIKQAYREMVKVWHPDRFTNDAKLQSKAENKMKAINEAYHKLCSY